MKNPKPKDDPIPMKSIVTPEANRDEEEKNNNAFPKSEPVKVFAKTSMVASLSDFPGFFNKKFNLTAYQKQRENSRERSRSPERIYVPHQVKGNGIPEDEIQRMQFISRIFKDEKFQKYYKQKPKKKEASFDRMIDYIVNYGKHHTPLEAAMMAFYFVCHFLKYDYNAKKKKTDNKYEQKYKTVYERGLALALGFTNLFEHCLKRLEIKFKHIEGYCRTIPKEQWFNFCEKQDGKPVKVDVSKSASVLINNPALQSRKSDVVNHCWNAIFVKGRWYFVDAMFGAGGVIEVDKQPTSDEPPVDLDTYFNPYYFMVPPELLICTHKPSEDLWQFTHKTLTTKQFLSQKLISYSDFYKSIYSSECELLTHPHPYFRMTTKDTLIIKLRVPNSVVEGDLLKASGNTKIAEIKYSFDEDNNIFSLEPVFPGEGEYIVHISSRLLTSTDLLYWPLVDYRVKVQDQATFDHFEKYKNVKSKSEKPKMEDVVLPQISRTSKSFYQPKIISDYDKIFPSKINKKICYDNENFHLIEPKTTTLRKGVTFKFKLRIKASNVALLDGSKWTFLRKTEEGIYEGLKEIETDNVSICCVRNKNVFTEVIKFKVHKERSILSKSVALKKGK